MKKLSNEAYLTLREGAKVIEKDAFGDKVLLLRDGTYLKLFRVKRLISSAQFFPYSKRFVKNARKLSKKGIPTVTPIQLYKIPSIRRTAVHYAPLQGSTLRKLANGIDSALAERLGKFIRTLHDQGVYFRSLHLGNIVLTPENKLGLIDVSDMKIYRKSLSDGHRLRNFQHSARYQEDKAILGDNMPLFKSGYMAAEPLPALEKKLADMKM